MDQTRTLSWREVWTRKLVYPGHTFPTAAAPVIVAIGLAFHDRVFAPVPALAAFLAGWLIQFAGVVTDNYENLVQQPEDREHPELVDAINRGLLTLFGLKATISASYTLALLAGSYLVWVGGMPVIVIGLASIVASWIYSAGPWPVGRHGLADPLFFLFFGTVSVVGTYYVQAAATYGPQQWAAALPFSAFAVSLPIGALITNILIIDDIRDMDFDVVKGKRTIAVRFGRSWSRAEFLAFMAFSYLAPFWLWLGLDLGAGTLLSLLTLPFGVKIARDVWTRDRFAELVPMTPRAAQLVVAYAVLLAIGLATLPG
ncbi:MAG: 1,4-dihydroxy-2-naphthoate octaprenyltransferase [Betaproteobacteria bacterium]|nr:1,4-dihydroxy-2-naphthoate octaprenyltransferase [Betaproteobacteria bacterium]